MKTTRDVRLETTAVEASGDLAVEDGVAHLVASDGKESAARYVVVWKRVAGVWRLHRDIWNTGPAAGP
jgi:ketosteroid isomerase-like protein